MIAYIRDLTREIAQGFDEEKTPWDFKGRFIELAEELARLDPRDFLPVARSEFVNRRRQIKTLAYDERISNVTWEHLRESKPYQSQVSDDTVKRHLLPLCAISEYPREPYAVLNYDWDSKMRELMGYSLG